MKALWKTINEKLFIFNIFLSERKLLKPYLTIGAPIYLFKYQSSSQDILSGIPDFSHIPPSSRLQAEGGATLVVDMENRPCTLPAKPIENRHPRFGKLFKPAAVGRRGVTAWVEAEGTLRVGAKIRLHIPDQPAWSHLAAARDGGVV